MTDAQQALQHAKDNFAEAFPPTSCDECMYAKYVPGSNHTRCSVFDLETSMALALGGGVPSAGITLEDKSGNEAQIEIPLVVIDPVGKAGGWANWPIDFDPNWITCRLPAVGIKTPPHE